MNSLRLLRRVVSPYEVDVLGISFEKGGASVLAHGCLVAGSLTPAQADILFGWGAFLQLVDDLQDVERDRRDSLSTVFSQTAGQWPLDALTNRVFHFGARVLDRLTCFDAPGLEPLKEVMRRSAVGLLVDAVGRAGRFYTRRYLRRIAAHSPFRFSFLRKVRKELTRQQASLTRLFEAFSEPGDTGSLDDLRPGKLQPFTAATRPPALQDRRP